MIEQLKGIIALDIDGTITKSAKILDEEIERFLISLSKNWQVLFLTGRTFSFAFPLFAKWTHNFFLGCQNGAQLFEMPSKKSLIKHYINVSYLSDLEKIMKEQKVGLLIEMGQDGHDVCYYNPDDFSLEEKKYLHFRMSISGAVWTPVASFSDLNISHFAAGKFFASFAKSRQIHERISFLNSTVTRDPFRKEYCVTLINHPKATKGNVLKEFASRQERLPIIAAGDDDNDVEMLQCADIKIVMQEGPEKIKEMADIVAPSFHEQGIVKALSAAIKLV